MEYFKESVSIRSKSLLIEASQSVLTLDLINRINAARLAQ